MTCQEKKGPDIRSFNWMRKRFAGYTRSGFDPGRRNIFQKALDLAENSDKSICAKFWVEYLNPIGGVAREAEFNKASAERFYDQT